MAVFVLSKNKKPLMPCSEKRARILLSKKQAVVHQHYPFTIRLKKQTGNETQPIQLKIDPGSRYTGVALVMDLPTLMRALCLFELQHRGHQISEALTQRRAFRRRRRNQLRYRPARFDNRTRKAGWLPPSVQHRLDTTFALVQKLKRRCPISAIVFERVKFDMQKMQNPNIQGVEYQHGTLFQYEVREYLLEKHRHTCAYCGGESQDAILEVEHKHPRAQGGSNSIRNLVMACHTCNQTKGNRTLSEFLTVLKNTKLDKVRKVNITQILAGKVFRLKDATAVNACRHQFGKTLLTLSLPVSTGTGAQTKYNRMHYQLPKSHALDALMTGNMEKPIEAWNKPTLIVKAMGRGCYQRTRLNQYGFPRGYLQRKKTYFGFQTGDLVVSAVLKGKKIGTYIGRLAVRDSGYFNIQTPAGVIQGISHKTCRLIQRNTGYHYYFNQKIAN
jgi:5-methylcytosine-specific restriction endonuclease McrA